MFSAYTLICMDSVPLKLDRKKYILLSFRIEVMK